MKDMETGAKTKSDESAKTIGQFNERFNETT